MQSDARHHRSSHSGSQSLTPTLPPASGPAGERGKKGALGPAMRHTLIPKLL